MVAISHYIEQASLNYVMLVYYSGLGKKKMREQNYSRSKNEKKKIISLE